MAEVLLFHHALGVTPGVRAFADELRAAGHTVQMPDLFEGRTFDNVEEGVALGVIPAQTLAQTRPGARATGL